MNSGFIIRSIKLKGHALQDAVIQFNDGLNIIAGPSDTGKTYIAQCINFAFGGSTPPKEIPEAKGYTSLHVSLEARDGGKEFHLERSLTGYGNILLRTLGEPERKLAAKHSPDKKENISSFLLELSQLDNRKIRVDQKGKTRQLSFRDLSILTHVDEEAIISESSPILSGQYTTKTSETSTFNLILSGIDDSNVIATEDPKIKKGKQEGKAEILNLLLMRARDDFYRLSTESEFNVIHEQQLAAINISSTLSELNDQISNINSSISASTSALSIEQRGLTRLEQNRKTIWTSLRKDDSKLNNLEALGERFTLLNEQYESDIRRLETIQEAGERLDQVATIPCPECGALPEHQLFPHQHPDVLPEQVSKSCASEAANIAKLKIELLETISANNHEIIQLSNSKTLLQNDLDAITKEINADIQPRINDALAILHASQQRKDICQQKVSLLQRLVELEELLQQALLKKQKSPKDKLPQANDTASIEQLCQEIESLLRSWHFPGIGRVTFENTENDIIISGRQRGSHGKGVRAILRAAFNLALLKLCSQSDRPYPGLCVIDSPLVVYRKPDPGEGEFPADVKAEFYKSLSSIFIHGSAQVIILENDTPPDEVIKNANCILFTKSNSGRRGFIPTPIGDQ